MPPRNEPNRRVKTADTVFAVVQAVHERDGATLDDLASDLGLARSTVHDHVSTLRDLGYLVRDDHRYYLSLAFLDHGMEARRRHWIAEMDGATLRRLADDTEEVAWAVAEENGRAVYLDRAKGDRAVQTFARVGARRDLHYLASGKAILAELPRERVEAIIDKHGLTGRTDRTVTTPDVLFETLAAIREQGYAVNDREVADGTRSVGVALVPDDTVVGAITVTGPHNRLKGAHLDAVIDATVSAANEIELKLSATTD
ncbi:DNA-binding IclR family transcriptional regulator [Halarchaeum rubridurum]|uniref:Transcriptional regulator n=1 Tax=Halarchaeum rubridurum TaxID=489911 RepID=A0A830FLV5_9EURY|nr:IclR family transcriptional regulator [Halarchaeum rubridurum]MBP1954695.1 DNA-binding IclR family transcriptional regulator [Halarchaeum rubridurum]GGM63150.1 transcriptional regulator [Halarchaeum rubridurum]